MISPEHEIADPAVSVQDDRVLLLRAAIDHETRVVLSELEQLLHYHLVLLRVERGQRVFDVLLQEVLERIVDRRSEHDLVELGREFVEFLRLLVLHRERNGVEFRYRFEHGDAFVEMQRRRAIGVLESLQAEVVEQHVLVLVDRAGGDAPRVVLEDVLFFQVQALELLEGGEQALVDEVLAREVAGAVVHLAAIRALWRNLCDQTDLVRNGQDAAANREKTKHN